MGAAGTLARPADQSSALMYDEQVLSSVSLLLMFALLISPGSMILRSPAVLMAAASGRPPQAAPQLGSMSDGAYLNHSFGFRYKVPFGWVDRTEQMREDSSEKSLLLLATFERPPEASGDSVNSAVVITAENTSVYPGLKRAADYLPLSEVVTAKGFKVVNQPYYFDIGSKQVAREDFSKQIGKVTMYQSSLVTLDKGNVVSFTFLGGSQDEVDQLIANLIFSPPSHAAAKK